MYGSILDAAYFPNISHAAVRLKQKDFMQESRNNMLNRIAFILLIACFLPGISVWGATTPPVAELGQFPSIEATDLDHTRLNLPQNFAGQLNLVIISFAREQQQEVDTWIPAAREIQSANSNFRYYEMLTMAHENMLYRWWFNAALRSNTTDKDLRSRILTAYVSKHAFQKSLLIADEKRVVAILVDQKGRVYWQAEGPYAEQNKIQLLAVLKANGA